MWICVYLAFDVIQATNLCLRGSCVRWQSGTSIDDGAGPPNVSLDRKQDFLITFDCFLINFGGVTNEGSHVDFYLM